MKTGLKSLDTGAPEITYSGNQGPKSPQEDQQKMAEFQLQEYMEEFERVFPDMKDRRGTPDYMKELQDYFEGLASKQDEGIGNMAMKPGLIDEYRNYKMGQEEAGEPFMSPRDYYRSLEQDRMDVKEGGIMRTAFRGGGMDMGNASNQAQSAAMGGGNNNGGNDNRGPAELGITTRSPTVDMSHLGDTGDIVQADFTPYNKRPDTITSYRDNLRKEFESNPFGFVDPTVALINSIKVANMTRKAKGLMGISKNSVDNDDDDTGNGDNYIPTPTVNLASIAKPITTDIEDENKFELRPDDFVSRFSIPEQFRLADGGRASYAGGGITDLRQGYFLGKLVKKATRGIKKIIKSPIGKIALAYAGGTYLGGLKGLSGAKSSMGFLESLRTPSNLRNLVNIKNLIPGFGNNETATLQETFSEMVAKNSKLPPSMQVTRSELMDFAKNQVASNSTKKTPGLGTMAAILAPAIAGGLYTKKTEENQPTLDEAMAQTSRGSSPFNQYGGVSGFRDMINKGNLDRSMFPFLQPTSYAADGGRIGLKEGGIGDLRGALSKEMFGYDDEDEDIIKLALGGSAGMPPVTMMSDGMDSMSFPDDESTGMAQATTTLPNQMPIQKPMMDPRMMQQMMMASKMNPQMGNRMMAAMGGRMNYAEGGDEGELLDMGGMEKDYRNDGGFVPMGEYERKDDVPARLSKNEFVFTADAVRNAGGGDIDKGAEIMENMMTNLENGGKVSKGSQGLDGAREMFATQQRLGEVL